MIYEGTARKVGDHIDTDAIIPARFLVTSDANELGANCMAGLEDNWVRRVSKGDILVAGRNFGCGSSREHAPIAILGAGMPVVIGHSFARIFYRNAFNMGLPLLEVGDDIDKIADGARLKVDTQKGIITNLDTGESVAFQPIPPSMGRILECGGLVGYTRQKLEEKKQKNSQDKQ